jgi:hypothetical protein
MAKVKDTSVTKKGTKTSAKKDVPAKKAAAPNKLAPVVEKAAAVPVLEARQANGERHDYISLAVAPDDVLEEVMRKGVPPKLEEIVGWEFKGYNTADFTSILGIRKFKKGFYRASRARAITAGINGYNVMIAQNPLGKPWNDIMERGHSVKHGWFNVYPVRINEVDNKYLNAVLLNYDSEKNFILDPSRVLRDYLVQVYPDNPDLLLGKAYVALGVFRVFVSYFILERSNRSSLA